MNRGPRYHTTTIDHKEIPRYRPIRVLSPGIDPAFLVFLHWSRFVYVAADLWLFTDPNPSISDTAKPPFSPVWLLPNLHKRWCCFSAAKQTAAPPSLSRSLFHLPQMVRCAKRKSPQRFDCQRIFWLLPSSSLSIFFCAGSFFFVAFFVVVDPTFPGQNAPDDQDKDHRAQPAPHVRAVRGIFHRRNDHHWMSSLV